MGRKAKDLTGMKFGRLTVIGRSEEKRSYWNCRCDCGNETIVRGDSLRNGRTTSCGCYKEEMSSKKLKEKWQDEEFRQMKSDKVKEQWKDEDFRKMKSERMKEQWKNEDFKKIQSEKTKEKWQDEEFRQMQREKGSKMLKEQWQDEQFRQMKSNEMREMVKEKWKDEEYRQMQSNRMRGKIGESSIHWKGGITPISIYLRGLNEQWFNDCKQQANYTCELTKKVGGKLHTHHLKAFNTIVLEAHKLHNIEVHEMIGEYTQEELHKLEEYVASWHKDNSNAVVLCKEVHDLFHSLYGKGDNTKEQYEEFKQRYLSGEFEENIK